MTKKIVTLLFMFVVLVWGVIPAQAQGVVAYLQDGSSGTDGTSFSFASQNLGAEAVDRCLILAAASRATTTSAFTIATVTIAGNAAAIHDQQPASSTNIGTVAFASVTVPTGTTGTVAFTVNRTAVRGAYMLWRATGIDCDNPAQVLKVAMTDPTVNLDVPANGIALGGCQASTSTTTTWTGLPEAEDANQAEGYHYTGASDDFASEQVNLAILCNTGASTDVSGVFISFSPAAPPDIPVELVQCVNEGSTLLTHDVEITGVGAGNLLYVGFGLSHATTLVSAVTDDNGNTYESVIGPTSFIKFGPDPTIHVWMAKNVNAGDTAVNVTFSEDIAEHVVFVCEVSGADIDDPVDISVVATVTSVGGNELTTEVEPTEDGLGVVLFMGFGVPTGGAGWSIDSSFETDPFEVRHHVQSKSLETGTEEVNATYDVDPEAGMIMTVVFRADDGEESEEEEDTRRYIIINGRFF